MSEKWEVVVRNKKEKKDNPNKNKSLIQGAQSVVQAVEEKKRLQHKGHVAAAPNLTFADVDDDDISHRENNTKKNNVKKPASAQTHKPDNAAVKPGEVKKAKQPKSIEQCLALVNVSEVLQVYESNVGGTSVSRLLDVARHLNSKILADQHDEAYSLQSLDYPLSAVPSALKQTLQKFIEKTSVTNIQVYLELCLSSIANYMTKGSLATGYKIMIQLIGEVYPKLFPKSINKVNTLMQSYQNRPPIGISLLWAAGQGGLHDIKAGLEVWQGLMVSRIDLRHYVKFVVSYLINMLKSHTINKNDSNKLSNDEVMTLIDFLNSKRKGMPKDLEGLLNNQASVLRKLYFEKSDAWEGSNMLEQLLERLPSVYNGRKQLNDITVKEIVCCFLEGLRKKESNYKLWRDLHRNYLIQSSYILLYLETNWSPISPTLNKKHITTTLHHFKGVYGDLSRHNKDSEAFRVSHHICQKLTKKVTKSRSCLWILGSILLLPVIASLLVVYDVQRNGSFEKSNTGQFLESMGVLDQTQYVWYKSLAYSARGYIWMENNVPYYYTNTVEFSKPYWELSKDLALLAGNQAVNLYNNTRDYAVEKWPVVQGTIEEYVPGFCGAVQHYSATGWNAVRGFSVSCYETTSTYLNTRVFIDNWAPEVLQKKTLEALNTTSLYASQYYSWFHQQVDNYSKLQ